jgi:hypothetical protein
MRRREIEGLRFRTGRLDETPRCRQIADRRCDSCSYRVAAQTSAKTYRLATLAGGAPITADSPMGKILTGGLAEHGYTLGQSLEI